MRLSNILFSLFLFSMTRATYTCATPVNFDQHNHLLKINYSEEMILEDEVKPLPLHEMMFKYSKPIGVGGFGDVREYNKGGANYVIKKLAPKNENQIKMTENEIKVHKLICDLKPGVIYNSLEECKSTAIAGFYGCVEDGKEVYIFQEKLSSDMETEKTLLLYHRLRGQQKADVMLQIISKFEEIHKKKIVHGDIKPTNLMIKGNDFNDIRIIDFGMSDFENRTSRGGTPYFIPPEQKENKVLSLIGDIYSLAVTFASFELSMYTFMDKEMKNECFIKTKRPSSDCEKKFKEGVIASFSRENETSKLANVMKTALKKDPKDRLQSMTKFKEEILKVYPKLPSVNSPRKRHSKGVVGFFRRIFSISDSIEGRILSSNSLNHGSKRFMNRILTEGEDFGSKMVI